MRLVHLTDPHLSDLEGLRVSDLLNKRWTGYVSWQRNRRRKHLPAVLERLSVAVKAEAADQVLLTGDLVQIGLAREIEQAAQWLGELGPAEKVMLVPGNHDFYARGSAENAHCAWQEYLFHGVDSGENAFPSVRKLAGMTLIGLSSACVTPVFMASGKLGAGQLDKLAGLLQQAASEHQAVCLLIHHPPLPGMTKWRKALADADALQAVLKDYPPSLIFHGHLHHNREQQWGNTRIYCTASASSVCDASYRVIDIEDAVGFRTFTMTLKSVAIETGGDLSFATIDEQSWQVQK